MAATYAHATAPLRRLGDRYVVEAALAVANGTPVPEHVDAAFAELPKVMARADELGNRVDNAVSNLAEAVLLSGREGELFDGVIVDEDRHGPVMQIADPAILARVRAERVTPGDEIRVQLVAADVEAADRRVPRVSTGVRVAERPRVGSLTQSWIRRRGRGGRRRRRTSARRPRRRGRTPPPTPTHRGWRATAASGLTVTLAPSPLTAMASTSPVQ